MYAIVTCIYNVIEKCRVGVYWLYSKITLQTKCFFSLVNFTNTNICRKYKKKELNRVYKEDCWFIAGLSVENWKLYRNSIIVWKLESNKLENTKIFCWRRNQSEMLYISLQPTTVFIQIKIESRQVVLSSKKQTTKA